MSNKKQKEQERTHLKNLAGISHALADRLVGVPSVRAAFQDAAHLPSKTRANALLSDIRISALEVAVADGMDAKDAQAKKLYAAMVERAEICATVALAVDEKGAEGFLTKWFQAAQNNEKYRDEKYADTLEKMGAPTLAKAARKATGPQS